MDYKKRIKLQAFGNKLSLPSIQSFLNKIYPLDPTIKVYTGFTMAGVNTGFSDSSKNTSNSDLYSFITSYSGSYTAKELDSKSELYQKMIEEVINEHKLSDGITLCVVCHDEIDERYRRYKGEGKKNLPRKL